MSKTPPPDFSKSYDEGDLSAFYALAPGDTQGALELPRNVDRQALADALRSYAKRLGAPTQVFEQLEQLEHPESRVVVTGQQAGLLLGPTYTLSKAVTALNLARELSTEERPVVPVFWVASQDHDTKEIDQAYLLDLNEQLVRLELPLPASTPAGRIVFEKVWLGTVLEELKKLNVPEAHLEKVTALLKDAAEHAETFADLFSALLYRLLGEQGLVVLNPLEPEIAPLFKGVLSAELDDPTASVDAVNAAGERITDLGYKAQLGRGSSATNLFLEEEGQRSLLRYDKPTFFTDANEYTREDLQVKLDADPSLITPAAGLRPITQDAALPTAVVVVGPGELRYFAQLKAVYEQHGVAMPLVWLRTTVTVVEPPVRRILEKFDLNASEVTADFESVKQRKLLELHGHAEAFDKTLETLTTSLETLTKEVRGVDPTLIGTVERAEERFRQTIAMLATKNAAALDKHDDIYARQFGRLEKHLLPLGTSQERLISPFSFFLKFGVQPVLDAFLELPTEGDVDITF